MNIWHLCLTISNHFRGVIWTRQFSIFGINCFLAEKIRLLGSIWSATVGLVWFLGVWLQLCVAVANRLAIPQLHSASRAPNYAVPRLSSLLASVPVTTINSLFFFYSRIHLQPINFWPVSTTVSAQRFAISLLAVYGLFPPASSFVGSKDSF